MNEATNMKFVMGNNKAQDASGMTQSQWEEMVSDLGVPGTKYEFITVDQNGGLHYDTPSDMEVDSYIVNATAKVAKKDGGFEYLWLGHYVNNYDMDEEVIRANNNAKNSNSFVNVDGLPVKEETLELQLSEADGVKLRRGWEIDPETGEPKFVGTKRDRARMARGEAPRDARLRGTLPIKLEPREKKKDPADSLPTSPKALELQRFLTDLYRLTGGGEIDDKDMLNQAKRITAGLVKLVRPATGDKINFANSEDGRLTKLIWNLSEISQRLGIHDLILANLLSRIADAFEDMADGQSPQFNPKDPRVGQLVKFVLTKFKNDIVEKKQHGTFPEMAALTEWFDRFVPEIVFETCSKKK
jgi:hypothetical protein